MLGIWSGALLPDRIKSSLWIDVGLFSAPGLGRPSEAVITTVVVRIHLSQMFGYERLKFAHSL